MRFYFGENGWPKSKLGAAPETDEEKDLLIDSLQVLALNSRIPNMNGSFFFVTPGTRRGGNLPLSSVP